MEWFKQIWEQLSSLLKWWVIVLPWEQGMKIWLGKEVKILNPGFHFRIPYFHTVYVQPIRITFFSVSPQTLTTTTKETLTVGMIIGYSITDIQKAYNSVGEVKGAICGFVSGNVASYISTHELKECSPSLIETEIKDKFKKTEWGIQVNEIKITTFALVKTYRLIQDAHWMADDHKLDLKR